MTAVARAVAFAQSLPYRGFSPRVLAICAFLALTLLPVGWNKFDMGTDANMIYLFGAVLLIVFISSWKKLATTRHDRLGTFLVLISVALAGWMWMAFAASPIRNLGWSEVAVFSAGLGLFLAIRTLTVAERKALFRFVVLLAMLSVIVGLAQYVLRPESRIAGPMFRAGIRADYWPNAFALLLLACWPLCLANMVKENVDEKRIMTVLCAAPLFAALYLTFSRAAYLAFLVQVIVGGMLYARHHKRETNNGKSMLVPLLSIIVLTSIIVASLGFFRTMTGERTVNSFVDKVTFAGSESQTSFLERWQFMSGALRLMPEHPWLGSGPFSFRFDYPAIQTDFLAVSDHPHNWFIKIGLEEGTPAVVLFILLLCAVAWSFLESPSNLRTPERTIAFIAVTGMLVHSVMDYNMNFLTNQILFWCLLGLVVPTSEAIKGNKKNGVFPWKFVLTVTLIAFSAFQLLREGALWALKRYDEVEFARSYFHSQASRAWTEGRSEEARRWELRHISLNPKDAWAWRDLGMMLETRDPDAALNAYRKAVESDPANVFAFYVQYVRLAQSLHREDTEPYRCIEVQARTFLSSYPQKVRANIHFTAQTANAHDALALASLLDEEGKLREIRQALEQFQSQQ